MEYTWKSGLERLALQYLRPNPFYSGVVNTLIGEQEVRVTYVFHFDIIHCIRQWHSHPHYLWAFILSEVNFKDLHTRSVARSFFTIAQTTFLRFWSICYYQNITEI